LILTQEALADRLPAAYRGKEVSLDSEQVQTRLLDYPTTLPGGPVRTNHLAYVIYTSGSTGKPKGVAVSHENVIRLLTRTQSWAHFTSQDVWVLFHSFAFDFSVWEIWGALTYGGCLVIPSYWVTRSPRDFVHLVSSQKVTVLNQTPSAFQQFMEYEARTDLALALRLIIFGGEWLQAGLLQPWFARHGDRFPQLVNMYGITETTVHVTKHFIRESETRSIIGRPLEDLQVYLCDKHMHLVPIGLPGEIYVGGPGLARQYLYRPELTSERFVPHPWSQEPGARLYRSGDMARYLPDGSLEYLGRRDLQVKLRGFRIELEEIATVLAGHTALNECVVMLQTGLSGSQELTAYCTLASGQEQPSPATLRAFLQQSLPAYMLPTSFLFLEAFPLNQNGKLDQRALPVPAHQLSIRQEQDFIAPATYEETMMTAIWQEVLGRETIGVNDNFFEMGGDSIRAIQIVSRARSIGLSGSVQYLFLYPCVRDLVAQTLANPVISLAEHRPEPFSLLTDTDRTALLKDSQTNKLEDAYPATTLQAGLIYQSQFHETYERYVTSLNIAIPFEHELFEQTLAALIERHEMLRTFFDLTHYSETIQCVAREAIPALHVVDLRALTDKEQEQTITDWIEAEKKQVVLWETLPLVHFVVHLRQSECIQLTLIEPFLDGWSVSSLLTELLSDYNHLLQQHALPARQRLRSAFASYV
ncbi:MAG TPA: amino acid adenylation domain-containing protein, partial [Ktedonobacteraceae bacterium]|nr:amino acid adenylation domain-containing protein [Ktedonobacteraceae bacterium]